MGPAIKDEFKFVAKRPQIRDGMSVLNKSAWISFFFLFLSLFILLNGEKTNYISQILVREKVALKNFAPWKYEDRDQDLSKTVHDRNY